MKLNGKDRPNLINFSLIWTAVVGTVSAMLWMITTFATADELAAVEDDVEVKFTSLQLAVAYGQYYDRLDDFDEAIAEDNEALAKEYKRQMERLAATICEHDPEWERCDD